MTKLLFLAGSARKNSLNKKLALHASHVAKDKGAKVTFIDLADFSMPIYDGDIEEESGLPENAIRLKKLFRDHDGIFIASPEYNSSMPPLLKNALDWISRPHEKDEGNLIAFKGKVIALGAVSPGALGGLRGLVPLRMMLGNIGVFVTPTQVAVNDGMNAFDDDGKLTKDMHKNLLELTINEFISTTKKISGNA